MQIKNILHFVCKQDGITDRQRERQTDDPIRHIAITICTFRFAFSHRPRCGQLLRQKHRNNFTWNLSASFSKIFRFQQAKPIHIVNLRMWLACWIPWIRGKLADQNYMKSCSCDQSCPHILMTSRQLRWRHNNRKQSASAREHWCDVSCDIPYY